MQLQIFNHNGFEIRGGLIDDKPYFVAMDIAKALKYCDTEAMTRRLDDDEIQTLQIVGFGNRGVNVINESGLYNAILGSKKPQAKAFKKWVTSEVLPSIRKNGYYINQNKNDRAKQEQILHNLITELQDSNTQKDCIKQENESLKDEVIALQRKLLALYDNKDKKEIKILPGHYGKRLSKEEKIQILSLREEGKSMREIQEIMQRSEHALYCVLREAKRGVL